MHVHKEDRSPLDHTSVILATPENFPQQTLFSGFSRLPKGFPSKFRQILLKFINLPI